ncbi:3-phosphoshikimate 1-carboxyvinyltransferase [hydrothermal vent metagenome]|uniref:3-phosphoshikimate 1-carboxyvinyltransferase n=1 Tax=hydrothermal vent metagenome TaxID=652676 RepID=A0A3B0T5P7_9ZZZZ
MISGPDTKTVGPYRGRISATVVVPGDKSSSHRALILAAFASGTSTVTGLGTGDDIQSTRSILAELGVEFSDDNVTSPGVRGWGEPSMALDCGNSGTTMRLMAGALSAAAFESVLSGDTSLSARPMERLVGPLEALGGHIVTSGGTAPLTVGGPSVELRPADVILPVASAQLRTAFCLAAVQGTEPSKIVSPAGFRDHTERWFAAMGRGERVGESAFRIIPGAVAPASYDIPGDPSSAAFLWAAAAVRPGSSVTTPGISLNPGRIGFLQVLEMMGAHIEAEVTGAILGDPVGTVTVTGQPLRGVNLSGPVIAGALDELPLVAVVASFAEGLTRVTDAEELRTKESDRVTSTVAMIQDLGGGAQELDDGFEILGLGALEGGEVKTHHDHRIAMAGAVAGASSHAGAVIHDAGVASVSWPDFYEVLGSLWS